MEATISKNQQKKLKKRELWQLKRQEKKKKKIRKPKPKTLFRLNREEWDRRKAGNVKVIIDCEFNELLTEREKTSLKQQIMFSYAENKKSENPVDLKLTGVDDSMEQEIKNLSSGNWAIDICKQNYIDLYEKEKLVYLTADATEEVDEFEKDKFYIIGGLVDHNRLKRITIDKANSQGIKSAKLPLGRFKDTKIDWSRVLAVNHVFQLVLKYVEFQDWPTAIECSLPPRKKQKTEEEAEENKNEEAKTT
ncbi:unnamed protein product [Blepharisma stoltei]|uniref:tRNA (guanine(9)-N(1))-methyltransferase n=1 Tax=Blepharisma stoltei TaxID=1481888 RepID=A0AAU9IY30_9CILI|nr:unnamed protein product [Blepharisma stoltei]